MAGASTLHLAGPSHASASRAAAWPTCSPPASAPCPRAQHQAANHRAARAPPVARPPRLARRLAPSAPTEPLASTTTPLPSVCPQAAPPLDPHAGLDRAPPRPSTWPPIARSARSKRRLPDLPLQPLAAGASTLGCSAAPRAQAAARSHPPPDGRPTRPAPRVRLREPAAQAPPSSPPGRITGAQRPRSLHAVCSDFCPARSPPVDRAPHRATRLKSARTGARPDGNRMVRPGIRLTGFWTIFV
nr:uncharacterized protein LOC127319589 [Lolium perenne]